MDIEIQQLMEELIMRRTQQKDYQSLEHQVRCLRQRFENLGDAQKREEFEFQDKLVGRENEIQGLS